MIVCVCARVTTQQIQLAIDSSPTLEHVVQATGACKSCQLCREEIDRLTEELNKYGLIEFVRGARIAIIKSSAGIHEKVVEFEKREPSHEIVENEYLDKRDDVFTM